MGAILLVAGTCIGSGMIALPLVLAKLGLIPSILLMLFIWYIMYYTSLLNIELNLQANRGETLGNLGKIFSGDVAKYIGVVSLKLLSYSLLAVFIYGGSSVLQTLFATKLGLNYSFELIATCYTAASIIILMFPIKLIDYCNRILFMALLAVVGILIIGLVVTIHWSDLPLFSDNYRDLSVWAALLPVVFTSFGFQVIFHTLTNYCKKDVKMLKSAFFWGSLIPAIVYILWTSSILSTVYHRNPAFYSQMIAGSAQVGQLIEVLSEISQLEYIQFLVWCISLLAITTSVLGVGVGLCDAIEGMIEKKTPNPVVRNLLASLIAVIPAYLVVLFVPNAFIAVLGFAGMILAVIAVLLPVYLLWCIADRKFHYPELYKRWLIVLSVVVGLLVIISELYNML